MGNRFLLLLNMSDRPLSAIAQTTLRKTTEDAMQTYPEAAKVVLGNSYMDDIPASVADEDTAFKIMKDIEAMFLQRGFQIKEWVWSGSVSEATSNLSDQDQRTTKSLLDLGDETVSAEKVLGMGCKK